MKYFLTLLLSSLLYASNAQTLFNEAGKGVAFIEGEVIYSTGGFPIGYISDVNIFNYKGIYIGFFNNGIWYNSKGQINYFQKGALSNVTQPDPVKSPKQPLPPRGPKELPPPKPPLQFIFASNSDNYSIPLQKFSSPNSHNTNISSYNGDANLGLGSNPNIPAISSNSNSNIINETANNINNRNSQLMQFKWQLAFKAKPYIDDAYRYYYKKDLYNAGINAKEALSIIGNDAHSANFLLGLIYSDRRAWGTAIEYFNLAIQKYSKDGNYYAHRGFCYFQMNEKKKSRKDLVKGKRKGSQLAKDFLENGIQK